MRSPRGASAAAVARTRRARRARARRRGIRASRCRRRTSATSWPSASSRAATCASTRSSCAGTRRGPRSCCEAQPQRDRRERGGVRRARAGRGVRGGGQRRLVAAGRRRDPLGRAASVRATHNVHNPHPLSAYAAGDPRSNFYKGVALELSTATHAEARLIARAARDGLPTRGRDAVRHRLPLPTVREADRGRRDHEALLPRGLRGARRAGRAAGRGGRDRAGHSISAEPGSALAGAPG